MSNKEKQAVLVIGGLLALWWLLQPQEQVTAGIRYEGTVEE